MAFHPQDEGLLAFGTGDGRVGIFNLTRKRNNVNLLKTVLAHPIYRLCWAPKPNSKKSDKLALYAVGNGQIIIYNDMNLWKGELSMQLITEEYIFRLFYVFAFVLCILEEYIINSSIIEFIILYIRRLI